jgi:hypothetical protein
LKNPTPGARAVVYMDTGTGIVHATCTLGHIHNSADDAWLVDLGSILPLHTHHLPAATLSVLIPTDSLYEVPPPIDRTTFFPLSAEELHALRRGNACVFIPTPGATAYLVEMLEKPRNGQVNVRIGNRIGGAASTTWFIGGESVEVDQHRLFAQVEPTTAADG